MDRDIYYIRRMRDKDIMQVLELDLDAFPTQWPHPTYSSYHHELRNKLAHYVVLARQKDQAALTSPIRKSRLREVLSYIRGLLEPSRFFGPDGPGTDEKLTGMAGIWMMVDEAHIVTIAVKNSCRRRGLGEHLLISIIDLALALRAKIVTLEVRVSNTVAQALYTKYGFRIAGTRRKYYSDNGEDALIMSTPDITLPEFREAFGRLREEHLRRRGSQFAPAI